MQNTDLKKFTEIFFNNLKCKVSWKDNVLIIENVPSDIEKLKEKNESK